MFEKALMRQKRMVQKEYFIICKYIKFLEKRNKRVICWDSWF